jgi:tRNA(Arg) A34 adenosine deaminase TadA
MCLAACHYARVGRVTWAASLADLHELTGGELLGSAPAAGIVTSAGVLREESLALLRDWAAGRSRA